MRIVWLLSVLLSFPACGKNGKDVEATAAPPHADRVAASDDDSADQAQPEDGSAPGPLTTERILAFDKGQLQVDAALAPQLARVEAVLGPSTALIEDFHWWAVADGDSCVFLRVENARKPGTQGTVGRVEQGTAGQGDPTFEGCLQAAGQK